MPRGPRGLVCGERSWLDSQGLARALSRPKAGSCSPPSVLCWPGTRPAWARGPGTSAACQRHPGTRRDAGCNSCNPSPPTRRGRGGFVRDARPRRQPGRAGRGWGCPPYLTVHDPLLLEARVEHVHGEHFAPEVAVVLGIVASGQVAKRSGHVGTFAAKEGALRGRAARTAHSAEKTLCAVSTSEQRWVSLFATPGDTGKNIPFIFVWFQPSFSCSQQKPSPRSQPEAPASKRVF